MTPLYLQLQSSVSRRNHCTDAYSCEPGLVCERGETEKDRNGQKCQGSTEQSGW